MTFAEHVADAAYHASLVGHLVLPYDYLSRPLAKRMAIAEPWYHELMQREADAEPRACWLLRNFPMLRYRDRPADFVPPPPRSGLRSACVIGPVAYVGGAERWAEGVHDELPERTVRRLARSYVRRSTMGNGSKLQETGGPTPAGLPPCYFLPLPFDTRGPCGPLNLFTYYIRNGYIP